VSDHDRDAHLMAALRHAPDRDVAPPAAVSRTILQQAQEATRAAPTHASVPWWTRMRQAFGHWTGPAPAAAFGTLAVAGIVGLMWATQDSPPGVVDEPATAAAPRQAVASSDARAQPAAAPLPQSTAPTAAPPTVADTRTQPSARPAAAKSSPRVAAAPVKAPIEAARADANAQAAEPAIATAPAQAPVPVRPAAPARDEPVAAVAPAAKAAPAAPAAAPRSAVPSSPSAQESAAFKPEAALAADAAAPARERRAAAAPSATAMGLARSNASPLAVIDRATAAQWLLPQGRSMAHGAPQQRWLADVQRGVGAWQRAEGPDPTASAVQLVVRDGDTPLGTLWLDGTTLWWRDGAGTLWTAQARDEQVRGWMAALKDW
jgi:hypothetical protein